MTPPTTYMVAIEYREPTYEERVGKKPEPYRWTFQITATTEAEASQAALREFRTIERLSGVGWTRNIVSINVRRTPY